MLKWLTKLGGDASEREVKKLRPLVDQINSLEADYKTLSDAALRDKTTEFRGRFLAGEGLDDLLPEAFAAVREAARRTIGKRHYDVQLIAGAVLHSGRIAEMRTGEGKTLVATLPLYLNALEGKGAHLVTPNDYLSRLGGGWMGPVYNALGLSVGVISPTERGIDKVESMMFKMNANFTGSIYDPQNIQLTHFLDNALKAQFLFHRDDQYIVNPEGEIVIVDEFTGRLMPGRRYSEGLHQSIEAKEGVNVQRENVTLARITFQNYFRMYDKLAGMTGTAWTEREEFQKIYDLDVVVVPTHRPMVRADQADLVYKTEDAKFDAVIEEIAELAKDGRPVLVGTTSVEKSERLSQLLHEKQVPHEVLNAKQHEREAWVIAQAGRPSAVTIATNMAGRGVDILLGGNPDGLVEAFLQEEGVTLMDATPEQREAAWQKANAQCDRDADRVRLLGGLHVLGTERHEA